MEKKKEEVKLEEVEVKTVEVTQSIQRDEVIRMSLSDFVSILKDSEYLIGMAMKHEYSRKRLTEAEWKNELQKFGKREVK